MALSSTTTKIVYNCDGTTTVFPYTFKVFDKSHLTVILHHNPSGGETVLTVDTDYSVSGVGNDTGGDVTLLISAPSTDYKLVILRSVPLTQEMDYRENDPFPAETHEEALDKLTMIAQQIQEQVDRALLQDPTQSGQVVIPAPPGGNKLLTSPTAGQVQWREGTYTVYSYSGNINYGLDADKSNSPIQGDIYYATDTKLMYICYTSGTWTTYYWDVVRTSGDQTIGGVKTFNSDIVASNVFRSGDLLLTTNTDTPTGWEDISATYENKFIRISSSTPLQTGGSDTHDHEGVTGGHALTTDEIPSHYHLVGRMNNSTYEQFFCQLYGYVWVGWGDQVRFASGGSGDCITAKTSAVGGGQPHNHTIAAADNIPAYIQVRILRKL